MDRALDPAASRQARSSADSSGSSLRVLLVDDQAVLLRATSRALASMGHQVESFVSSTQALSAFRENPDAYDVLIADENMPALSGSELLRAARDLEPRLWTVLVTGHAAGLSGEEADRVLTKPFRWAELDEAIRDSARRTPSSR